MLIASSGGSGYGITGEDAQIFGNKNPSLFLVIQRYYQNSAKVRKSIHHKYQAVLSD
jgi:hypothetical protein